MKLEIIATLLLLTGCGTATYQDRIIKCMGRIIDMGGGASESFEVCQKMQRGNK